MLKASLEDSKFSGEGRGLASLLPNIGLSLDPQGHLYAVDTRDLVVRRLCSGSDTFELFAGCPNAKKTGRDGLRISASSPSPSLHSAPHTPSNIPNPQALASTPTSNSGASSPSEQVVATFEYPRGIEAWDAHDLPNNVNTINSANNVNIANGSSKPSNSRVWIADFGAQTIRVVTGQHVRTVVGEYGQKGSRDGLATPLSGIASSGSDRSSQGGELALLSNPFHIVLLRSRPLLLIFEKDAPRIRMLDLNRWTVSTLHLSAGAPTLNPGTSIFLPSPSSLASHPYTPLALHFIDLRSESSIFKVNLETGDVQMDSQNHQFKNRGFFLPIISSDDSLAFASSHDGVSHAAIQINGTTVFTTPQEHSDFRMALAYLPQSNTLIYRTKDGRDRLTRGFLTYLRLPKRDWSCLLQPPHVASDLIITHQSSGESWKLHSHVLKSNEGLEKSLEKAIQVVSNSKLPVASIESLWRFLYYSQAITKQGVEGCIEMSQLMHLIREIGVANFGEISIDFASLVAHLQPEEVSESLIKIWGDANIEWKEGDEVIQVLKREVKKKSLKDELKKQIPKSGLSPAKVMSLAMLVASNMPDLPSSGTLDAINRKFSLVAINLSIESIASSLSLHFGSSATTTTCTDSSSLLDFKFLLNGADGEKHVVRASSLYMYGQWQWFRDLMTHSSHSCNQTNLPATNHAANAGEMNLMEPLFDLSSSLPWMTLPILLGILESLHSSFKTELNEEDAWLLCSNAKSLKLADASTVPIAPFEALLTHAMEQSLPLLTTENRFKLIKRAHSLGLMNRVDSMIDEILASSNPPTTLDLLENLDMELITRMKAKLSSKAS